MKNFINLKTIIFCAILAMSISCDDDDVEAVISTNGYPIATFEVVGGTEIGDRDGALVQIAITIDKQIKQNITFDAIQIGGTAEQGVDFDIVGVNLNAYSNTANIEIIIYPDLEIEGDETIELQVTTPAVINRYLLNPVTVLPSITLNIKDYVFCLWTLDAVDTYGDGWNGASIRLTTEGQTIDYATEESHDLFDIPVTLGEDYSFEFVSGDWDGEIEYTLTAPDGTVYADAYYPATGVITSGVSECN